MIDFNSLARIIMSQYTLMHRCILIRNMRGKTHMLLLEQAFYCSLFGWVNEGDKYTALGVSQYA